MSVSDDKKDSKKIEVKKEQSYVSVGKGGKGSSTINLLNNLSKGKSPFKKESKQAQKEVYGVVLFLPFF